MKLKFWDYIRAAFNARPLGMFVPPNWVGLAGFALLGLLNPGFWLVGAGLELGYLYTLSTNRRFQNWVEGMQLWQSRRQWQSRRDALVSSLVPPDHDRYFALENRCRTILAQQQGGDPAPELQTQSEGLGRLLWMYLRLMLMRQSIARVLREAAAARQSDSIDERVGRLQEQIKQESLSEELRKSLTGQLEILQQRRQSQKEAKERLAYLNAELTRIEEQVELIREQAVVSTDSAILSQRIDQIAATLGSTNQWIREQQQIYGQVEDLLSEPPAIAVPVEQAKEVQ
jgi:hypothetical protein